MICASSGPLSSWRQWLAPEILVWSWPFAPGTACWKILSAPPKAGSAPPKPGSQSLLKVYGVYPWYFFLSSKDFMLDACKFLRVHHDTHRLNPLCPHLDCQHEIGAITGAKDQRQLTIDCCQLNTGTLWQKAPGSQGKACHRITSMNGVSRRSFDFAAAIDPEGHIFGQHVHQWSHLPSLSRLQKPGEHLPVGVGRCWEAGPMVAKMFLRPAEPLATGHFTFAEKGGNLGIVVLEDFAQQEDRPLDGLQLLQQQQERQRNRLLHVDALLQAHGFERLRRNERLW